MQFIDALDKHLVQVGLHFESKKRALETISAHIAQIHHNLGATSLFEKLMTRERLGSTGIGNGIAIPHCRTAGIDT